MWRTMPAATDNLVCRFGAPFEQKLYTARMRVARAQHVWVDPTGTWGEHACRGVLIAWRQCNDRGTPRWQGWVVYAMQGAAAHGGDVRVGMEWIDAALIRPARSEPPKRDLSGYRPANHDRLR